jgi:hypothetical protein
MDRSQYTVVSELAGQVYQKLLTFALGHIVEMSFVISPLLQKRELIDEIGPEGRDVLNSLQPYLSNFRLVSEWPGTMRGEANVGLYRYKYCQEVLNVMVEAAESLYGWRQPSLPEDVCLYTANGVWLGSVSHEHDCFVRLTEQEKRDLLNEIPEIGLRLDEQASGEWKQGNTDKSRNF